MRRDIALIVLTAAAVSCTRAPEPAPTARPSPPRVAEARTPESPVADVGDAPAAETVPLDAPTNEATEPEPTAASGPSYLGTPTAAIVDELPTQQWIQDGGQRETATPAEGRTFLVLEFPDAPEKVSYTSTDFTLAVEGEPQPLSPHAVTSPTANPIQPRSADLGPARFQREVWMFVDWEHGPNTPFAVAFEVPATASSGVLRIKDAAVTVRW